MEPLYILGFTNQFSTGQHFVGLFYSPYILVLCKYLMVTDRGERAARNA